MHHRLVHLRVGRHKTEHRRHVGANHAGTFADTGDAHRHATQHRLCAEGLGHSVGGHDAFSCAQPMARLGVGNGSGQTRFDSLYRQRLHDHARRKRQDLLCRNTKVFCQTRAGAAGARQALFTRARIGVTSVDQQCPDTAPRWMSRSAQVFTANLHGCCAKAVLRENTAHGRAFVKQHDRQVFSIGFADTRFGDADSQSCNRAQAGCEWGIEVDRHEPPLSTSFSGQANRPWHCLYFLPLPQGQGSLRPTRGMSSPNGRGFLPRVPSSTTATTSPVSVGAV